MPDDIVLIGPVRTGKTTLGGLLAKRLRLPQVSLDVVRWQYYREIGYDETLAKQFRAHGGFLALYLYRNQFDAYAVERLLQEHQQCVIDFGAGIYESLESLQRVQRALATYPNVILLLPGPDTEESVRILRARDPSPPADISFDILRHLVEHPTYASLARFTVYTKGKTPAESCAEILSLIKAKI